MLSSRQQIQFVSVLALVAISFHSSAQHNAAIKAQTFRVFDGLYTASFEQAVGKRFSAQVSLEFGDYVRMRLTRYDDYEAKGLGVIGAFRYYPFTKKFAAPQGFFTYAAFRTIRFHDEYIHAAGSISRSEGNGKILNIGGGIGYKFVYHRFGLEGFVGWGAGRMRRDQDASMPEFYRGSLSEQRHFPQLDIALCYMLTTFAKK
jgi:hypothetical protein